MSIGRISGKVWFLLLGALAMTGCASVRPSLTPAPASKESPTVQSEGDTLPAGVWHEVVHRPKDSQHFTLCQKLNPIWWFGNADDPEPPASYHPESRFRNVLWHLRNPGHNLTFYVIGIADKAFVRAGRYPRKTSDPDGGWNWAVCKYRRLRLPYADYRRNRFEFYWGWRTGGNFGMKLNFAQAKAGQANKPGLGLDAPDGEQSAADRSFTTQPVH